MDLTEQLQTLRKEILGQTSMEEAFSRWRDIRPWLSDEQRVQILAAWNRYLRAGKKREVIVAIGEVLRDVEE